jgi:arylsulfatase A-like enzyme
MRLGHQGRPNIIVILIDTLRADHLSSYGYARPTSPCIDRIAERGVLYDHAISPAAWTPPAHASLFTGTYPSRHGVDRSHLVLNPELTPLPEALRRHGYRTFGISSNYWLSRETRFDRGFDVFVHGWQLVQTRGANIRLQRQHQKHALGLDAFNGTTNSPGPRYGYANAVNRLYQRVTRKLGRSFHAYDNGAWRVNHQVRRWAADWKRAEQPFFAFLHYMDPHIPYEAPGSFYARHLPDGIDPDRARTVNQDPWRYLTGRTEMNGEDFAILRGLYDGEISYVDYRVGQLYNWLEEAGLLRNTLLIITSDHGENLGEHHLMDHAYCLYDTLLHVPLIIRFPSSEYLRGGRITAPVQTLDLLPTILTLAGVHDEDLWDQVQGQTLFPADVRGRNGRLIISEYLEPQPPLQVLRNRYAGFDGAQYDRILRAVRASNYKYIWASDGGDELYDLATDPAEEHNLIATETGKASQLRASLEAWVGSFAHPALDHEAIEVELDSLTIKRLEDLGYLAGVMLPLCHAAMNGTLGL